MATRYDLVEWLEKTLRKLGGRGTIVEVSREIWQSHEPELRNSGELFYTWQYDVRWAATTLRKQNKMKDANVSPKGVWELNK